MDFRNAALIGGRVARRAVVDAVLAPFCLGTLFVRRAGPDRFARPTAAAFGLVMHSGWILGAVLGWHGRSWSGGPFVSVPCGAAAGLLYGVLVAGLVALAVAIAVDVIEGARAWVRRAGASFPETSAPSRD